MRLVARLVVLASLVAAGCVGDPVEPAAAPPTPPTPVEDVPPEPEGPRLNVTRMNGSVAGAGDPSVGYVRAAGENVFDFEVPPNATGLVIEVKWDSGAPLDVQAEVPSEHCTPVDPVGLFAECPSPPPDADGQSPARIEVVEPDMLARAGTWSVGVWARSSGSAVPFEVHVTVFEGGKPPAGYSAIPG